MRSREAVLREYELRVLESGLGKALLRHDHGATALVESVERMADRIRELEARIAGVRALNERDDVQWVRVSFDNDATDGVPWCVEVKQRDSVMSVDHWAATYDAAIDRAMTPEVDRG